MQPFFAELYKNVINSEIEFIKKLIDQGRENKQIRSCDSKRNASNLITVGDAIKQRECTGHGLKTRIG